MSDIDTRGDPQPSPTATGCVARLWRYPVKSMLGEPCEALALHAGGAVGDRCFAVRVADGRLGSGKTTDGLRRIEGLLDYQAGYRDDEPEIRCPDGTVRCGVGDDMDAVLSAALGQPVTLVREAEVSHFDVAPIHLVTMPSLAWLRAALPDAGIDERRFRPNLVLDIPAEGPVEQGWIGRRLYIGEVELEVTEPTERCGMVSLAQRDHSGDPRILRHIVREADLLFGVYASVVVPGTVRQGDSVAIG